MRLLLLSLIASLFPVGALGQDRAVTWDVAGGPVFPAGSTGDAINHGFGAQIGATVRSSDHVHWRIDALITRHGIDDLISGGESRPPSGAAMTTTSDTRLVPLVLGIRF